MPDDLSARSRVIFLNRFYWPEEPATAQLLTDLAEGLAKNGARVTVITSHSGRRDLPRLEVHRGVEIKRVRGTRWAASGGMGKAADFLTFYVGAMWKLFFTAASGDAVISLTDPPLIGVGTWLVARMRGARVFHWVQDIYPEIAIALTGHAWLAATRPLRNAAWRHADGCVTLGSDMARPLIDAGVSREKITIVPNWAPAGTHSDATPITSALRAEWNLADRFVVAYSGNLGRVHDLDPVIELATELRDDPRISFVFVGGGAQRSRLEALASARALKHVQFRPAQPRDRLAETLALGEVHLVTLLPGCEQLVFPSKLYGVTVAGRPVIFIGPRSSELAQQVEQGRFGRAFDRSEIGRMADVLRSLSNNAAEVTRLSQAASEFGRPHRGPSRAIASWETLLGAGARLPVPREAPQS